MSHAVVPDSAARYDWECRHVLRRQHQDVPFWADQVRRHGGVVLELACGSGRLANALVESGFDVTGLDIDPAMVAAARRASPAGGAGPTLLVADMRRFCLARRYGLVLVGYNSLQLLTGEGEAAACLGYARRHLGPGGAVGLEVTEFQDGGAEGAIEVMPLATQEGISLSGSLTHTFDTRTSHYRRRFEGPGWAVEDEVVVRSYDEAELLAVVQGAGLEVERTWQLGRTTRLVAVDPRRAPS